MCFLTSNEALNLASSIDEGILLQTYRMRHICFFGGNPKLLIKYCQESSSDGEVKYFELKSEFISNWKRGDSVIFSNLFDSNF